MMKSVCVVVSLCVVLVIVSAGCTSTPVNSRGSLPSPGSSSDSDLTVTESHLQPSSSSEPFAYVVGSVTNNGGKTYSTVEVTITLQDASGTQVGITMASGNNVAPGGVWNFKAPLSPTQQQKTASYTIKSIRGM